MDKKLFNVKTDLEDIIKIIREDASDSDESIEDVLELDSDDSDADPEYVPSQQDDEFEDTFINNIRECETTRRKGKNKADKNKSKNKNSPDNFIKNKLAKKVISPEIKSTIIDFSKETEFIGKNGFKWNSPSQFIQTKHPAKNIIHISPGTTVNTSSCMEPLECFDKFLTLEIMEIILKHTNEEIERQRMRYSAQTKATISNVNLTELKALFGLIILAAAMQNNHLSTNLLFDDSFCGSRYVATMSKERFNFLINCLRFDDKISRAERQTTNKFSAVSDIWERLLENCRANYRPGAYVTIDEQLVAFRGKCPFRMYIPSKPDKYGIKIVMMCDNATKYMIDATPYLGKGTVPSNESAAEYFVNKLIYSIRNSNRNVTFDNWFTSVPLVQSLLKKHHLTAIGTIRKNKREFPEAFVDINYQKRDSGTSLFLFHEDLIALSYKPKPKKLVCLISSAHLEPIVCEQSVPQMVKDYNKSKGAVDTFDQMCHHMNCGRKTKRWPLCIFYNIINISCLNSYVILTHNHFKRNLCVKPPSRLQFMLTLHQELTKDWQMYRLTISTLPRSLRSQIENASNTNKERHTPESNIEETNKSNKGERKYCGLCSYKKRRYTTTYCMKCHLPVCGEHQQKICSSCGI